MWWRRQKEQDLERELRAHLEAEAAEQNDWNAARRALGNTTRIQEEVRASWGGGWFLDFCNDIRFAVRQLRKAPGFTAVAVVSLALGIGANTAIFTLIDGVLLENLPVRDPRHLLLFGKGTNFGVTVGESGSFSLYSTDLYRRLRKEPVFEGLCAFQSFTAPIAVLRTGWGATQAAQVKLVSGNYFQVLGVSASVGRLIADADDSPSAAPVAVVSYRYWNEKLNADPGVVGSRIDVNRVPVTIIGVTAPSFYGETTQPDPAAFWIPITADRQLKPDSHMVDDPDQHWLSLLGRLRPGVSREQAQTRLTAALQNWLTAREGSEVTARRRREIGRSYIELTPGGSGVPMLQQDSLPVAILLLGAALAVLMITCANVANLLLARGEARVTEISMRLALGASRWRLIRQSLTESLAISICGAALGLLAAPATVRLLLAIAFPRTEFVPIRTTPNLSILAFTLAVTCATTLMFGILPALRTSSGGSLRMRSFGIKGSALSSRTNRTGKALIVTEVALSLVLLSFAASFTHSLKNLSGQNFGFEREHVLVVSTDTTLAGYPYNRLDSLYRQISARLGTLPGVRSVSLSFYSPFNGCCWGFSVSVPGYQAKPGEFATLDRVSPRYFETLGTPLLRGRTFDERDTPAAQPVIIVSRAFADLYFPGQDPIGRHFEIGSSPNGGGLEIVGVVEDAKYNEAREKPRPMAFLPLLQVKENDKTRQDGEYNSNFIRAIEVRAIGRPEAIAGSVRQAMAEIDRGLPLLHVDALAADIKENLSEDSIVTDLVTAFGVLALALTCVGLYGLMAYLVERRTSEIGIRIALGAQRRTVIGMVTREVLVQGAIGLAIGIPAAFGAMRLVATELYGVKPSDPVYAVGAAVLLLGSMVLAGFIPARRASRVDPAVALRHE